MQIFLLDMGNEKYGDCILVENHGRTIIVDGGHINDDRDRGAPSIPRQLAAILGHGPPFRIDLLVVTHCHGDHIGCLPSLIGQRIIIPTCALLAHPDLGYPPHGNEPDAPDPVADALVAALREEPRTDFASDGELDQFIADAGRLEDRYRQMVESLDRAGVQVIRFAGVDDEETGKDLRALCNNFADFGLEVLGPNQTHVLVCTELIENEMRDAREAIRSSRRRDSGVDAVALYKLLSGMESRIDSVMPDDISAFIDRPGKGAALNNQSIVLKVASDGVAALLTGDMQFAQAEVDGLNDHMSTLLRTVEENGPYAFVKLPHHASYNGFDERLAEVLSGTVLYGISTGRGDPGHPNERVLKLLRGMTDQVQWVRTDKNGGIKVTLADGSVEVAVNEGRLNDTSPNRTGDSARPAVELAQGLPRVLSAAPMQPEPMWGDNVEVIARIPRTRTRVTITVDIDPAMGPVLENTPLRSPPPPKLGAQRDPRTPALGGGRALPPLLFATSRTRLVRNIGSEEANRALSTIERAGQRVLDIPDFVDPLPTLRRALAQRVYEGVVILGGYDVLRSWRYDALPPSLRQRLGTNDDPDDFVIWSDQVYGDLDGDNMAELPVSRIPDGQLAALVEAALTAGSAAGRAERFGLRNINRPFASDIYDRMPGSQPMLVSEPARRQDFQPPEALSKSTYFMLHGSELDSSVFWGELTSGGLLEAFSVENIPARFSGVVFAGCCWGALTTSVIAARHRDGGVTPSIGPAQSIALGFLLRGALAFVGCTGAHYSPIGTDGAPLDFFGGPLHQSFWGHIARGDPPAKALFAAKMDYISGMPHGRHSAEEQAIEHKILRQFTCLGLGW